MATNRGSSLSHDELDAGRARRDNVAALIEKSRATRTHAARLLGKINATPARDR